VLLFELQTKRKFSLQPPRRGSQGRSSWTLEKIRTLSFFFFAFHLSFIFRVSFHEVRSSATWRFLLGSTPWEGSRRLLSHPLPRFRVGFFFCCRIAGSRSLLSSQHQFSPRSDDFLNRDLDSLPYSRLVSPKTVRMPIYTLQKFIGPSPDSQSSSP